MNSLTASETSPYFFHDPDPKSSERRRLSMIQGQLINRGIWDQRILNAFNKVKRHEFVSEALYSRAYDDNPLPIGSSQTISQPYIVAYMTQELILEGGEKVLEIGTGSGFQTAILAELSGFVYSLERIRELYDKAKDRLLRRMGYHNVRLIFGNGLEEIHLGNFDRILIAAGASKPPERLMQILNPGGYLIAPIGDRDIQYLYRVTKLGAEMKYRPEGESWSEYPGFMFKRLTGCRFVPLIGPGSWQN